MAKDNEHEQTQADDPKEVKALAEQLGDDCKLGKSVDHWVEEDLTDEEAEALVPQHLAKLDEIDAKQQEMEAVREEHRKAMKVHADEKKAIEKEERSLRSACRTKQRRVKVRAREVLVLKTKTVLIREVNEHGKFGEVLTERPFTTDELKLLQRNWVDEQEGKTKAPKSGEPLKASVGEQQKAKRAKKASSKGKRSKQPGLRVVD